MNKWEKIIIKEVNEYIIVNTRYISIDKINILACLRLINKKYNIHLSESYFLEKCKKFNLINL